MEFLYFVTASASSNFDAQLANHANFDFQNVKNANTSWELA